MDNEEKIVTSEVLYAGKILDLKLNTVELPNGELAKREIVKYRNGVGVLPVDGDTMLFVKQYRSAIEDYLLEIPAGLMEGKETPEMTGTRELQEEIGLKPTALIPCGKVWPTPGCCDEETFLFIATQLEHQALEADDDEFIEVVRLPIQTVRALYDKQYFTDAKTVCALGYYFSHS